MGAKPKTQPPPPAPPPNKGRTLTVRKAFAGDGRQWKPGDQFPDDGTYDPARVQTLINGRYLSERG